MDWAKYPAEPIRPSVLIVDDDLVSRSLAREILGERYAVEVASDAHEARGKLLGAPVDVVLLDVFMPGESGMDLARWIVSRWEAETAVIMVSGGDDPELADEAFELGAYSYLVKPYRSADLLNSVRAALHRRRIVAETRRRERELERDIISKSLETERTLQLLRHSEESLERSRLETVHRLSLAVEMRDQVTGGHISRMGAYSEELACRLDLSEDVCGRMAHAAQMHDIGKIAVPDHILLKRGPLTIAERRQMETHTEIGRDILQGSESPLLQLAESIAWTHHERFDGTGYPRRLAGDHIPVEGRIAAVADVFDALTRDRPYRDAMPLEEALAVMADGRGTHFAPDVLDVFMAEIAHSTVA
jgi:putative two-component system response regulator